MDRATAYAPGSASNLGPGFDCLGLAFTGKGDSVTALRSDRPGVRVNRVSDPRIPLDAERNTAAIAARAVLARAASWIGLELTIEKGLPLSGGMGGSAASAVAGAVAANAVSGAGLSGEALMAAALEAEAVVAGRHLDNIAPSLLGGAVLVAGLDPPRFTRIAVHASIALVLVTPEYQVETARARAVLPSSIARADAIQQAGHLALLVLGLERGDPALLRSSLEDRIAEPARLSLYPGFEQARADALAAGAHGVCVSGAGPTVLALATGDSGQRVGAAMAAAYRQAGFAADVHLASVDQAGARVVA